MKRLVLFLFIPLLAYTQENIRNTSYSIDQLGRIAHAIREIENTYGDNVSVYQKSKSLIKFGRNDDVGTTEETVWLRGGLETYATGNDIDSVSSSNSGDTQSIIVEGHTISGDELTFVVQSVTLTGQTPATLTTPLYRATRLYNNGSSNFAGTVYCFESGGTVTAGVPQTTADIHLQTDGVNNQSLKAATSISNQDYWIVTGLTCSVNRQNTRSVDFKLQLRLYGKTFRTIYPVSVSSNSGSDYIEFNPCIIIPKNSDVRVQATSSGASTGVEAAIHGYLALVKN